MAAAVGGKAFLPLAASACVGTSNHWSAHATVMPSTGSTASAVLSLRLTNNGSSNYRMMDVARLNGNNTIAPTPHRHRRSNSLHASLTDGPSNTNNTITNSSNRRSDDDDDNKEEVSLITAGVVSTSLPFNRSLEEKKASLSPSSTSTMLSLPETLIHDTHSNTILASSGMNAASLTQMQRLMLSTASYTTFKSSSAASPPTSQLSSLMMASTHRRLSAAGLASLNMQPNRYISYGIAAAAAASATGASTISSTNGTLIAAARSIPHPDKIHKGGEDAHFLSPMSVGVFDGVGGWAEHGVDPAEYSRALGNASKTWANNLCTPENNCEPKAVMNKAFHEVRAKRIIGSTTACIVSVNRGPRGLVLKSANLGDSGFLVIRDRQIVYQSTPQTHGFNFPRQLGAESEDLPEHADSKDIDVLEGDVVVLGTDGLFDNLSHEKVVSSVVQAKNTPKYQRANSPEDRIQALADQIANDARDMATSEDADTPFAKEAIAHGHYWRGGKMDDITVVVAQVRSPSVSPSSTTGAPSTPSSSTNGTTR